ncbi:MAG: helix-turn-helix domain-containing protein [Bacteroidota bacterium]
MDSLYLILAVAGISIILFLNLLLAGKREQKRASRRLQGLLFALTPFLVSLHIAQQPESPLTYIFTAANALAYLVLGPLLYEYAWEFYYAKTQGKDTGRLRYLPFIVALVILPVSWWLLPPAQFLVFVGGITLLGVVSLAVYLHKFRKLQRSIRTQLKDQLAHISHVDLRWVQLWAWGLLVMLLLDLFSTALIYATEGPWVFLINGSFYLFMVVYLGYYGITQPTLIVQLPKPTATPQSPEPAQAFDCTHPDLIQLKADLVKCFEEDQYYTREGLSLGALSGTLGTTDKKLSFLINQCMETNFYELVNAYRLQDFLARVAAGEAQQHTLLAVAFAAGFNSKATFNRVFKDKMNQTPAQYLKSRT